MKTSTRWAVLSVVCIFVAVLLTWHSARRVTEACELLQIAQDEAQLAEAWHLRAGKALATCGVNDALATAESKACYARRFNDDSVKCD